jgi:hypothetical protein
MLILFMYAAPLVLLLFEFLVAMAILSGDLETTHAHEVFARVVIGLGAALTILLPVSLAGAVVFPIFTLWYVGLPLRFWFVLRYGHLLARATFYRVDAARHRRKAWAFHLDAVEHLENLRRSAAQLEAVGFEELPLDGALSVTRTRLTIREFSEELLRATREFDVDLWEFEWREQQEKKRLALARERHKIERRRMARHFSQYVRNEVSHRESESALSAAPRARARPRR